MSELHTTEEKPETSAEIIQLADVTGRKTAGQEPPSDNWLEETPVGTYFLVTKKNDQFPMEAVEVFLMRKTERFAYLVFNMPDKTFPMWVNMLLYSKTYRREEVIRTPEETLLLEDKDNQQQEEE